MKFSALYILVAINHRKMTPNTFVCLNYYAYDDWNVMVVLHKPDVAELKNAKKTEQNFINNNVKDW